VERFRGVELALYGDYKVWGVGGTLFALGGFWGCFFCTFQKGFHLIFVHAPGDAVEDVPCSHTVEIISYGFACVCTCYGGNEGGGEDLAHWSTLVFWYLLIVAEDMVNEET
jgi:hypothetical protein